ncbi:transcriptional regulator [Chryseobacterium mucoviscidosis]|uniref:helix-turn-helix domain-containing protein n=1 Tax=unclassified Paenibacillus TaxID=185978 RepID=UPI0009A30667|nr:transcriptional regulator [Chryseobacterium mucoviscidosis]
MAKVSRGRCRLKQLLKERRMKQIDLSTRTGYSPQLISNWANNHDKMSSDVMFHIAYVLDCHVEELYELVFE